MVSTKHTQSLTDFRQKASETIERLNRTGESEIITVNGEAKAVLVAPAIYDQLAREVEVARDVVAIRKAMKQFDEGNSITVEEMHKRLRDELLAMKAAQDAKK